MHYTRPDPLFLADYTNGYDDLSRRTTVKLGNGTTTNYGYNDQSALDHLAHNLTYTGRDNTWTYTRNRAQELTDLTVSNDGYQWDGYGGPGSQSYTRNGLNQYTDVAGEPLSYDDNGNLEGYGEWAYTYNPDNRLKTANNPGLAASLLYDAEGRLRQTAIDSNTADTLAGITTRLLYAGSDLIAEYDGANILQRRYVHGPGVDEPLVWYEGADTTHKTWLYADHQGSIVATANASK